jgi:hypothetical protein
MSEAGQTFTLISQDGQKIELPLKAAQLSKLVQNSLPEDEDDPSSPYELDLLRVGGDCLKQVVAFLIHHAEEPMNEIPVPLGGNSLGEVRRSIATMIMCSEMEYTVM